MVAQTKRRQFLIVEKRVEKKVFVKVEVVKRVSVIVVGREKVRVEVPVVTVAAVVGAPDGFCLLARGALVGLGR